jgi:hypothetical protein
MKEKRGEMSPKSSRVLGNPHRCCLQLDPSKCDAALQNQQAKACWKCCKTPRKVTEIFCVYTENFQQTNMIDKLYFDLSMTNISAEK